MKKILVFLLALTTFSAIILSPVAAEERELYRMRATAYCLDGITRTGIEVRKGICATSNMDWLGKTAVIYQRLPDGSIGKVIGIYEIQDTGCKDYVVDVWMPNIDECQCFMDEVYENNCGGKVWLQIVNAEG